MRGIGAMAKHNSDDAKKNKYPFVIFEGVDGAGKTTHAELLAKKQNGLYIKNPPKELAQSVHLLKGSPLELLAQFYFTGNCMVDQIALRECQNRAVIADRHIHSTKTYYHGHIHTLTELSKPDLLFYLYADWQIIDERLSKREIRKPHEALDNLKLVDERYRKFLVSEPNVIYINTTTNTIEQTARSIEHQFKNTNIYI